MTLLFADCEPAQTAEPPHNVFFALRPDAAAARALCGLGRAAGQTVDAGRLHISLYSLGMHRRFPSQEIAAAARAVRRVQRAPFLVELDRLATWGRGRGALPVVVWADDGVGGVRALHDDLHEAVAPSAASRRCKPGIEPHLTLWRARGRTPVAFIPPIRWWVREFVLLDSRYGAGRHEVLDRFALVG